MSSPQLNAQQVADLREMYANVVAQNERVLAENKQLREALEWLRRTHAQDTNRYIIEQIERALAGDAE